MISKAEELMVNPTDELREALKAVQDGSASSESTARRDFEFDDGSILIVQSHAGGEPEVEVVHPPEPDEE